MIQKKDILSASTAQESELPNARLTCFGDFESSQPTLLLIHGWGASSDIWQSVAKRLEPNINVVGLDLPGYGKNKSYCCESIEAFLAFFEDAVLPQLPAQFYMCGWSLGGLLATKIARRFHADVQGLITVACNPAFVSSAKWPDAVSSDVFERFLDELANNSTALLKRFSVLQTQGSPQAKQDRATLRAQLNVSEGVSEKALALGLQWLKHEHVIGDWQQMALPALHQYGESDQLVPVDVADRVAALNANHIVERFAGSSHLPFLSEPERWSQSVLAFIQSSSLNKLSGASVIKNNIAEDFSVAAPVYDELADFQHRVGEQLLAKLPGRINGAVLDLGSGTGYFSSKIQSLMKSDKDLLLSLDIADGMLKYARSQAQNILKKNAVYVQADFDCLPIAKASFELIFSNLAVQWSVNTPALLSCLFDALKPGGRFYCSTLLPGSLQEIIDAWSTIDANSHVHEFEDASYIVDEAAKVGFTLVEQQTCSMKQNFAQLDDLLNSVKGIGARRKTTATTRKGLMGKQSFVRLASNFEAMRNSDQQLPLTYQVAFFEFTKPVGT